MGLRKGLASPQAKGFQRTVLVTVTDTSPKFLWFCQLIVCGNVPLQSWKNQYVETELMAGMWGPSEVSAMGLGRICVGWEYWEYLVLYGHCCHFIEAQPHQRQDQGELEVKLVVFPLLLSSLLRRRIHSPVLRGFANIQFSLQPSALLHSSSVLSFISWAKVFPSKELIQEIKSSGTEDTLEPPKAQ